MNRNNNGFTLTEILICIMIVGFLAAIATNAISNVRASYTALTYSAHKIVQDMVGTLYSGHVTSSVRTLTPCYQGYEREDGDNDYIWKKCQTVDNKETGAVAGKYQKYVKTVTDALMYNGQPLRSMVTSCVQNHENSSAKGIMVNVLKTDGEKESTTTNCTERFTDKAPNENLFCKSLVALSNISGSHDCTHLLDVSWNSSKKEPQMTVNFNNPNFTLTNGMRFYISKWNFDTNVSYNFGYRLVAVDVNGKKGPNAKYSYEQAQTGKLTDLVTFLVMDNGEVFPLSEAADNVTVKIGNNKYREAKYLNANVKGYYNASNKNSNGKYEIGESTIQECKTMVSSSDSKNCVDENGKKVPCKCTVRLVKVPKNHNINGETRALSIMSYREAYCGIHYSSTMDYRNYCLNASPYHSSYSALKGDTFKSCPPSTEENKFDYCAVETVKPAMRLGLI